MSNLNRTGPVRRIVFLQVMASVAITSGATASASAALLYDAGGFEPPRFTLLPNPALAGQDPASPGGPWVKDGGTSTAIVQTNNTSSGLPNTQAIRLDRVAGATGDTRWRVNTPATPAGEFSGVRIDLNMSVDIAPVLNAGPRFGIEAYDNSATPQLIGGLVLDAAQGTLLYRSATTGNYVSSGVFLARNAYQQLALVADFASQTYSIYSGGSLLHTEPFVTGASTFGSAPLAVLSAASASETGRAYVDGFSVSTVAVPEPAGAAVVASAVTAGLLSRRRRA